MLVVQVIATSLEDSLLAMTDLLRAQTSAIRHYKQFAGLCEEYGHPERKHPGYEKAPSPRVILSASEGSGSLGKPDAPAMKRFFAVAQNDAQVHAAWKAHVFLQARPSAWRQVPAGKS